MSLPITAITKFTFQDYPKHTACIIWLGGCSLRCKYCHNPEFITEKYKILDEQEIWKFLKSRIGLLDAVVLSGGECMLSEQVIDFITKIKELGFKVKIDTNGTRYSKVEHLINNNLIDAKAPKEKFTLITDQKIELYDEFSKTLDLAILNQDKITLEVRTTVHTDLLNENDINQIIQDLDNRNYQGTYYIQNFRNDNKKTLGNLPNQTRILDKSKLIQPKNFQLDFRNFW